eukprot:CAMPEP_0181327772 /NCGR_PEP_ID=MMETSP1101-20121128/22298_1 /TAXON_ID=46948 /ORGANISM="Rhodomonas abbreviata, Strain Caron Lab Isolate" /LENGTH=251 /DNA_ID=CAMNT_0023436491 /DNA_START=95 /DNA_END=850 /DNA_ORIENTATION=-
MVSSSGQLRSPSSLLEFRMEMSSNMSDSSAKSLKTIFSCALGATLLLAVTMLMMNESLLHEGPVELDSGSNADMATIDKMLSHIHALTRKARAGSSHHSHATHHHTTSSDSALPTHHDAEGHHHQRIRKASALTHVSAMHEAHKKEAAVAKAHTHHHVEKQSHSHGDSDDHHATKAHSHVNKALAEAEAAEQNLSTHTEHPATISKQEKRKKLLIAKKMEALQAKINNDFKSVMNQGKKAGYLPPVKMPHM